MLMRRKSPAAPAVPAVVAFVREILPTEVSLIMELTVRVLMIPVLKNVVAARIELTSMELK